MELSEVLKGEKKVETVAEKPETTTAEPAAPAQESLPLETTAPVQSDEDKRSAHKRHMEKEYAAQGRNPDGTFAPKTDAPKEAVKDEPKEQPKVELTPKEKAFLADAQAERGKRQELERRLAALEQQRQQVPQPPGQQPAPTTFWDNPDAALQQHTQNVQQSILQNKMHMSEAMARRQHPDFEEKIKVFAGLMQATPGLFEQFRDSPDPGEFAYTLGKNTMELQQVGGMDGYRKKVEEETAARVRKEIEGEQAAKEADRQRLAASLPRTLSDARGVSQQTKAWGGPTPLTAILKH